MTDKLTLGEWIIYLRLSEFAADDDAGTFEVRADELSGLAADIGAGVLRVAIENDVDEVTGRVRGASASKARTRREGANGLAELRTRRPEYQGVLLDLKHGAAGGVIVERREPPGARLARRDGPAGQHRAGRVRGAGRRRLRAVGAEPRRRHEGRAVQRSSTGSTTRAGSLRTTAPGSPRGAAAGPGGPGTEGRARGAARSCRTPTSTRGTWSPTRTRRRVANATADALLGGASVKACVRDLRERALTSEPGTATVSGAPWSSRALIGALIKPAMAGLQVKGAGWVKAPWPPVIEREKWDRLRALLLDPERRTHTGTANEPRWLVSVWARCGVCGGLLRVGGAGRGRGPAYVGQDCGHIRRDAHKVDELIEEAVLELLERPGLVERLRPPPRPGADRAGLAAELDELAARRDDYRARASAGRMDPDDVEAILDGIGVRERAVRERLAATAELPDVLARFREEPARAVWASLDMSRRRAVVQRIYASVTINRAGRGGRFDPAQIDAEPREDVGAV